MKRSTRMSELPQGWTPTTLKNCLIQKTGKVDPKEFPQTPYLAMDDIESNTGRLLSQKLGENFKSQCAQYSKGDILYGRLRPYLNKVMRAPFDGLASAELLVYTSSGSIDLNYAERILRSQNFLDYAAMQSTGDRPRLSPDKLVKFSVWLPPLAEQKRIVEKLDSLTTSSREAAVALSNVETLIERYRAAVLNHFFDQADCQRGKVADFAEIQLGKMLDKRKNKGVLKPYLRNISVRWGSFNLTDLKEMKFEDRESEKFGIKDGDLIVCEGGEPGRCAVWRNGSTKIMFQKALMRLRCKGQNIPEYLYFQLTQLAMAGKLEEHFTGTTIKHLPQRALYHVPISIHPPEDQIEIVARIEAAFSQINIITSAMMSARSRLEALNRAMLDRAFKGKLVPQDPDDEPASTLLERVKREREAAANIKPKRKPSKAPRAKKKRSTMTKSRFDDDVKGKPYLATILKDHKRACSAVYLYNQADLTVADFYKQLAFEVASEYIRDLGETLEAA